MTVGVIAAAVIVFAGALFRQIGVPKMATVWAEDGAVFLQCAYDSGPLGCLAQSYQGYLHLVPRAIAAVAATLPPEVAPAAVSVLSALVAAGSAAIAARAIVEVTGSPLAGLLGAIGLGLVWQAGREVLGNTANVHWVLLCAAMIAIACSWLGARVSLWVIALVGLTGLTSALAPLLAVMAGVTVLLRRQAAWSLFTAAGGAAVVQIVTELTSVRATATSDPVKVDAVIAFIRDEVVRHGFFGGLPMPAGLIVPGLIAVTVVAILAVQRDRRAAVKTVAVVAVLVVTGLILCVASIVLNRATNPRYAYVPTVMMVAALALAAGALARALDHRSPSAGQWGRVVGPLIVVIVGAGFALSFRVDARASNGPDVPAEIRDASASCPAGSSAAIPISPTPATILWLMKVPCSRLVAR